MLSTTVPPPPSANFHFSSQASFLPLSFFFPFLPLSLPLPPSLFRPFPRTTQPKQELSEQFILDCTPNPNSCGGHGGCQGGTAALAYDRLKAIGGMPSEWTYPYISGTGNASTCHGLPLPPASPHHGGPMASATISGHVSLESNSYDAVIDALANTGPLAVTVDAGAWHDCTYTQWLCSQRAVGV